MTNVPFDSAGDFRDIESINYFWDAVTRQGLSPDEVLRGVRAYVQAQRRSVQSNREQ